MKQLGRDAAHSRGKPAPTETQLHLRLAMPCRSGLVPQMGCKAAPCGPSIAHNLKAPPETALHLRLAMSKGASSPREWAARQPRTVYQLLTA